MASKVEKTKYDQEYTKKPRQCNNCKNYQSELIKIPADRWYQERHVEKNKRCGIGGFAVLSSASCKLYEPVVIAKNK